MSVNASQLKALLVSAFKARLNILVTGAPGIGKTEIIQQAALEANADLIVSHPAIEDPTDAKGFPWPDPNGGEAKFLPFGNLAKAKNAKSLTVWDLEDLGQANASVQASYMPLLKDARPEFVTFVASTNRRIDRAGVTGILEPVKSRFAAIFEYEPVIDDWCSWAYDQGWISTTLIAFLRFRSELLSAFVATADLTNSPTPRTWSSLARLENLLLPLDIEKQAFAGAVGEAAADEYLVFRQLYKSMVNLDAILADPDHAAIPTSLDQLYATSVGLAGRANDSNFGRIATYATRLATEANRGEFAVLLVRDAQRRDPKVITTHAYVQLHSGPIGKLFSGN